jgi:type II restriction/modification system DNA methylase subunit YeeA
MDKNRLKSFAIESRRLLMRNVAERLNVLGFGEKKIEKPVDLGNEIEINGIKIERHQYEGLKAKYDILGYQELVEEMAYTWFNRFTALRFMELNGYIEEAVTESITSKIEPGIVDMYSEASFYEDLTQDKKMEIHQLRDSEKLEELYVKLIEYKCDELNKIMPFMFEKMGDYTELLFPMGLLREGSFLTKLREAITKEDREENSDGEKILPVEIIGWLYQFYNSEKKDEVFAALKKNVKINKENIPAATQLFTPKWIVKYMVENSLGKLALESLGVDEKIKENWKYYIEADNGEERTENSERLSVEEIKILDPAMGSGHMLVYAFDVLYQIYDQLGYSSKDAVVSILKNNLFGLEIDDRAGQLAGFALIMKGREKFRRLFRTLERESISLNALAIEESNVIGEQTINLIRDSDLTDLKELVEIFKNAKEYGSVLKVELESTELYMEEIEILKDFYKKQGQMGLFGGVWNFEEDVKILEKLARQGDIMSEEYDVTITNPPYMGSKGMSPVLSDFVKKEYPDSKSDLFSVFMEKCGEYTKKDKYTAMITMHSWMFLSSFEKLRTKIIDESEIDSLVHLGTRAFQEIGGEVVQTVSWITKKRDPKVKGTYLRLVDYNSADWKEKEFFNLENRYTAKQKDFEKIPGSPIAYWVSDRVKEIFAESESLGDIGYPKQGLATADNDRFLRLWNEVSIKKLGFGFSNAFDAMESKIKWFPCNKGGSFRKWYGNNEIIVNWKNNGLEMKNFKNSVIRNEKFYFKEGLTWSTISSSGCSFRYSPKGHIFETKGSTYFVKEDRNLNYIFGFLNTKIVDQLLLILSPTLDYHEGPMSKLPVEISVDFKEKIEKAVQNNIYIAKQEWDSRETSWDFGSSALSDSLQIIDNRGKIATAYESYCNHWIDKFVQMHKNEEELNRLFIEIYDLEDEMDPYVDFNDITLLKKEAKIVDIEIPESSFEEIEERDKTDEGYLYNRGAKLEFDREEIIKQLISYGVGCIMGRYSLDKAGLIMANSDDQLTVNSDQITIKGSDGEIRHEIKNPRFLPDEDGIIPIVSDEYFGDDIVERFVEFVKAAYGEKSLEENLNFIAKALGKKSSESSRECIRRYFVKDFMKDHVQRYKKRPIYWLMDSGKKDGFKALIYLHRYHPLTVGAVRTDYLLKYQEILEGKKALIEKQLLEDITPKEKKDLEKELKVLDDKLEEIRKYDSLVKHYAEKRVNLDLDDGVKVNYGKLDELLYKITGL